MAKLDGGDLALKVIKKEGAKYIFSLSGTPIKALYDSCIDECIPIIDTRHEEAAVHMADGWARVTGQPGVAMLTSGPGVANGVGGTAVAFASLSPIVVIGGKSPMGENEMGPVEEMDQIPMMMPVTKWARTIHETRRIPDFISTAFRQARTGRPAPVFLDIPRDVLEGEVEEKDVVIPDKYLTTSRPYGDPDMIKKAIALLAGAKRPLVLGGGGVWWSQASKELRQFIETINAPLVLDGVGRGSVPEDHPLCFGPTRVGTKEADVVVVVGMRLDWTMGYGRPPLFGEHAKFIQIDIEGAEIGRNRAIEVGIVGDCKAVLGQLTEAAQGKFKADNTAPWVAQCQAYVKKRSEKLEAQMNSEQTPIHPLRLCKEIKDFLDRDAVIIMDGADIGVFGGNVLRVYEPGHWMENPPSGSLGIGIPFGMAAKLAKPDKQVLVLNGDGAFGFNGMEFDTAVRHKIPFVTVIGNDSAWGFVKHVQEAIYGKERIIGTTLNPTRYDKMVEALGGYGEYVERPQDIRPALKRAFDSGLPACINVKIDPDAGLEQAKGMRSRMTSK